MSAERGAATARVIRESGGSRDGSGVTASYRATLRRGFVTMMPLWLGAVPFGLTYGILAREAGFAPWEAQAGALLIFSGSALIAMLSLVEDNAALLPILGTMLVLNLRNLLYGLSLRRELTQAGFSRPRPSVPLLGFALTDESYGMTIAEARTRDDEEVEPDAASATPPLRLDAFLFGASLSLYVAFPMSTLAGIAFGSLLPDTDALGLEMIFPLCFLAVLLPLLRGWRTMIVALVAASLVLLLGQAMDGGTAMFLATVGAAGLGAILERGASEAQDV